MNLLKKLVGLGKNVENRARGYKSMRSTRRTLKRLGYKKSFRKGI